MDEPNRTPPAPVDLPRVGRGGGGIVRINSTLPLGHFVLLPTPLALYNTVTNHNKYGINSRRIVTRRTEERN